MFALYDAKYPREAWLSQIRKAFNCWQSNCGLVFQERTEELDPSTNPPVGYSFNTPGNPQGDSRFGDIRIGTNDSVAWDHTYSPIMTPGITQGGDIMLNATTPADIPGQAYSGVDLYSLMLHCLGGAIGLLECDMPSVMSGAGPWPQIPYPQLFAWDVEGGQTMYGPARVIPPNGGTPPVPFAPPPSAATLTNAVFLDPGGEYMHGARIQDCYTKMLGRIPDASELPGWHSTPTQNILATFANAAEFYNTCADLAAWITKVYQKGLNRTPSQSEIAMWIDVLT
jgi:hypothetical protein